MKLAFWIIAGALAAGCVREKKRETPAAPQNKPAPQGDGRTTDEGEGVPGYLTDASLVVVTRDASGRVQITAPDRSVASDGGDPSKVRIEIWSVARADVEALRAAAISGDAQATVRGSRLGVAPATATGAFAATVDCAAADCFLAFSTRTVTGSSLVVGRDAGALGTQLAARDLAAAEAKTFPLLLSAFIELVRIMQEALKPEDPVCALTMPKRCYGAAAAPLGETRTRGIARDAGGVDACKQLLSDVTFRCLYPPGTTATATYDGRDGGPVVPLTLTTPPPTARCRVTLPAPCAVSPETPLAFDDPTNLAGESAAACAARAAALTRVCGFGPGQVVGTTFHALGATPVEAKAEGSNVSADAPCADRGGVEIGTECEPRFDVYLCFQPYGSERQQSFGVAGAGGLECYLRGFSSSNYGYSILKNAGPGRLPLRRFLKRMPGDLLREMVVVGDAAAPAGWEAVESLGYVLQSKIESPWLRGLYDCRVVADPELQVAQSVEDCGGGATLKGGAAIGYIFNVF